MKTEKRSNSIQSRLITIMLLMLGVTLLVNIFINRQINTMVQKIDSVFASNVAMDELSAMLARVEENIYDYLNTKSSGALENYYRYAQDFQGLISKLNDRNVDNESLMMEKNIRTMSGSFLEKAELTISAKRGRNVERYRECFEETSELYGFINNGIYELNRLYFANNSANYERLLEVMAVLERGSIIVIISVFLICFVLVSMMIHAIIEPLRTLSDTAMEVAGGNLEVPLPEITSNDEIGIVTSAFRAMLLSIREYIRKVRESALKEAHMKEQELELEAHLKEAQLQFLQAQINPHFLFNSLNAAAQLAMLEDAEGTGEFLQRMADFFRYNVKKINGISTIREEIETIDNYIYILNVRFAGDITYIKEIDDEVGELQMPGLILQPIVENAVNHGIHDNLQDGIISLSVIKEEEHVRILVKDNGVGMTKERIAAVMEDRTPENRGDSTSGIGLHNVINRLNLYYKREGIVSIRSEGTDCGTEVTVLLPLSMNAEN